MSLNQENYMKCSAVKCQQTIQLLSRPTTEMTFKCFQHFAQNFNIGLYEGLNCSQRFHFICHLNFLGGLYILFLDTYCWIKLE